jgi:hypothetical protein
MTNKGMDEKIEIQSKIGRYISIGKENIHFQVERINDKVILRLMTFNPIHNQSFLFHSVSSDSEMEAYREMLGYVQYHKEEESSYTIQWSLLGENKLYTSYFRANTILGALDKLYFDRDPNTINVFSVMLNPIS